MSTTDTIDRSIFGAWVPHARAARSARKRGDRGQAARSLRDAASARRAAAHTLAMRARLGVPGVSAKETSLIENGDIRHAVHFG